MKFSVWYSFLHFKIKIFNIHIYRIFWWGTLLVKGKTRNYFFKFLKINLSFCILRVKENWITLNAPLKYIKVKKNTGSTFFILNDLEHRLKSQVMSHDNETWLRLQVILKILTVSELWSAQGRGHNITTVISEHMSILLRETTK